MHPLNIRRALALLLCVSPVFWMSDVALAQTIHRAGDPSAQRPFGFESPAANAPATDAPGAGGPEAPDFAEPDPQRQTAPGQVVARPFAVDEPVDPDRYVCGHGDVLTLDFWGLQNFRRRIEIDLEGRAFVPKLGFFVLTGKTLSEARRELRQSVRRFYPRVNFDVALAEPRTFLVQVVDDVVRPGSYPARAVERVATLVARAGGFGPNASKRRVEIRRRDGTVIRADLLRYETTGDVRHNPYLLDGDVVRVPFEDVSASITGAVNRPGRYELIGSRDLAELVELAGGLAPIATRQLPINLVRRQADDRQDQRLVDFGPGGELPAIVLQHEDSLHMPSYTELQQSVLVVGAVSGANVAPVTGATATQDEASATRRLPFVRGDSVRTLLERIGGVGPLADLSGAYLIRSGQSIPVDLYSLVMLRDLKADRPVELGDTLVVPLKRRSILVQGAVFAPGAYAYNPAYGIEQYVALAGGPNRFAEALSDVRVITPNGETKGYRPDLKIEPGSSLVVPERNFSRAEIVQIGISIASVIVSGVAVVIAARR
jgi:polysaccharide export outer membrane protein